jgi:4a-hydroxytetrahydrobiopterin dehydratase
VAIAVTGSSRSACHNAGVAAELLTRTEASTAVEHIGWRYLLGALTTTVGVRCLEQAVEVTAAAVAACGPDAGAHLLPVPRPDRVELTLQTASVAQATGRDVELAHAVTEAIRALGLRTAPKVSPRPVQALEIAIDAMDIASVRPFWRAVLAYTDEPGRDGPTDAIVDPLRQGPAVWFQQMDRPRPQRNRIHLDVTVAHDEADERVAAALAAGGTMVSDAAARAYWVLADPEGNEVCVCTWQDRD